MGISQIHVVMIPMLIWQWRQTQDLADKTNCPIPIIRFFRSATFLTDKGAGVYVGTIDCAVEVVDFVSEVSVLVGLGVSEALSVVLWVVVGLGLGLDCGGLSFPPPPFTCQSSWRTPMLRMSARGAPERNEKRPGERSMFPQPQPSHWKEIWSSQVSETELGNMKYPIYNLCLSGFPVVVDGNTLVAPSTLIKLLIMAIGAEKE